MITLRRAVQEDCPEIHRIQVKAFAPLLKIYRDHASSPVAESVAQIRQRFAQPFTDYYLICEDEQPVGMLRVCNFGEECQVSPICILPEHQGRGYASIALILAELQYPNAKRWALNTIQQEPSLCHLYESLGYVRTGRYEHIKEGMDLVYYRKDVKGNA